MAGWSDPAGAPAVMAVLRGQMVHSTPTMTSAVSCTGAGVWPLFRVASICAVAVLLWAIHLV